MHSRAVQKTNGAPERVGVIVLVTVQNSFGSIRTLSGRIRPVWPELTTLKGLDLDFQVNWLTLQTKMTADDLLMLEDNGTGTFLDLISAACQIPKKTVLPSDLKRKPIMKMFLDDRALLCGSRFRLMNKENRGEDYNLTVRFWSSYLVEKSKEGFIVEVLHQASGKKQT